MNYAEDLGWILFVIVTIFIITAVSNGANLTDGLDGLATGTSAIIGATLGILAYVSGNMVYADYLNIMYIPHSGGVGCVYFCLYRGYYWFLVV